MIVNPSETKPRKIKELVSPFTRVDGVGTFPFIGKSVTYATGAKKHPKSRLSNSAPDRAWNLYGLRDALHLSISDIARITGVEVSTARAWLAVPGSRRFKRIPLDRLNALELYALPRINARGANPI